MVDKEWPPVTFKDKRIKPMTFDEFTKASDFPEGSHQIKIPDEISRQLIGCGKSSIVFSTIYK